MKRWIHAATETYNGMKFDDNQMKQIRQGLESGVDVGEYADPEYSWSQMYQIRRGLEEGLDVSKYANPKYSWRQMREILEGLKLGFDMHKYADLKFDGDQMRSILYGLQHGVDVAKYVDTTFDAGQISQIIFGLKDGLDVSWYADPKFNAYQMEQIRLGLKDGIDVSKYADPQFDYEQMMTIRTGNQKRKSNEPSWNKVIEKLSIETEDGIDSLYEQTNVGSYIENLCKKVENKLGVWLESSVQGGVGSISIHDSETDELIGDDIDYEEYSNYVLDIALSSGSAKSFSAGYKQYLEGLMWG